MVLVSIFFVSGADAASVVMGTLSQRGSLHPSRGIVIFWGVVMGAIAAVMLLVGGDDALTGIQNLTIIMAVPFGLVMVLLCLALTKDLRHDPLMRRHDRSREAVEQAVDYGMETYGDRFFINVKCSPTAAASPPPKPAEVEDDLVEEELPAAARALPRL
jgi:choline-glycine betaine transporter